MIVHGMMGTVCHDMVHGMIVVSRLRFTACSLDYNSVFISQSDGNSFHAKMKEFVPELPIQCTEFD